MATQSLRFAAGQFVVLLSLTLASYLCMAQEAPWQLQSLQALWQNPQWGSVVYYNSTGISYGDDNGLEVTVTNVVLEGDPRNLTIPSFLCETPNLASLILNGLGLTGTIPSNCGSLNKIDLSNNLLSGTIPETLLGNSTDPSSPTIVVLRNNLLSGTIPHGPEPGSGGGYPLNWLDLSFNDFEGTFSSRWFRHSFIHGIILSHNPRLGGEFPTSGMTTNDLKTLFIAHTNFSGTLPIAVCSIFEVKMDGVLNLNCANTPACCLSGEINCGRCTPTPSYPPLPDNVPTSSTWDVAPVTFPATNISIVPFNAQDSFFQNLADAWESDDRTQFRYALLVDQEIGWSVQVVEVTPAASGAASPYIFRQLLNTSLAGNVGVVSVCATDSSPTVLFDETGSFLYVIGCQTPNGTRFVTIDLAKSADSHTVQYATQFPTPVITFSTAVRLSHGRLLALAPSCNRNRKYRCQTDGIMIYNVASGIVEYHYPLGDGMISATSISLNKITRSEFTLVGSVFGTQQTSLTIFRIEDVLVPNGGGRDRLTKFVTKQILYSGSHMNFASAVLLYENFLFIGDFSAGGTGNVWVYFRAAPPTEHAMKTVKLLDAGDEAGARVDRVARDSSGTFHPEFVLIQTLLGDYDEVCTIGNSIGFDGKHAVFGCNANEHGLRHRTAYVARWEPAKNQFKYTNEFPLQGCGTASTSGSAVVADTVVVMCSNATQVAPVSYFWVP